MVVIEFNRTTFNASGTRSVENETTQWSNSGYCNFDDDPTSQKLARVIAYCLIIAISTFGNSVTISVVWRDKKMRKLAFSFFIVNLAAADLTITLVYMPRAVVTWIQGSEWIVEGGFGSALCKIVPFLHVVSILVSILTLLIMAVDRFLVIVFPLRQKITVKSSKFLIVFVWLLAIAVQIPYFYSLKIVLKKSTGEFVCSGNIARAFGNSHRARAIYYTFLLVAFYGFPLIFIIVSYSVILVTLRLRKPWLCDSTDGRRVRQEARERASRKIFYMMLTVTSAFVICWLTYFIAKVVYDKIPCNMRFWRFFLAHSNSALNPFLYALFNDKFRQGYKRLFVRPSPDVMGSNPVQT